MPDAPASAHAPDTAQQLAEALRALQDRHDELLGRFLGLIEERRALEQSLFAERVKAAGLQRDLGVFQREWHKTQTELTEIRTQNDHHKQLALDLQGRLAEMRELSRRLQRELEEARGQRDEQAQAHNRVQQQLRQIKQSRGWQLTQQYRKLTGGKHKS